MKKTIIKLSALALCVAICLSAFGFVSSSAMSIEKGVAELRTLWSRDIGPEKNGIDIDYSYYSPIENGASADKKYPMVIIMAGALEGLEEGFELEANNMPKWTAEEYQSRFENENAFLFIARAPEESKLYWDSSSITPSLKAAIDEFCVEHKNVDTDKIYIIGWCLGGNGAINLATSYPNDFAATIIMCPNRAITKNEAYALKNMPVWFMGSKTDTYANYATCILKSFNSLREVSARRADVRLTSYRSAPDVTLLDWIPFIFNHNLWDNVADDLHTTEFEYPNMETVDGNKNAVENPYVIKWFDFFSLADGRAESTARDTSRFDYRINVLFNERHKTAIRAKMVEIMLDIFARLGWI